MKLLLDVFPGPSATDRADLRCAHPEGSSQCGSAHAGATPKANCADQRGRQFDRVVLLASRGASLPNHVCGVVFSGAKEQVIGTHASRLVAPMAHMERRIADWAVRQFVGESLRMDGRAVHPELSVSISPDAAIPEPAHAGPAAFVDVLPEPSLWRRALGFVCAVARTVHADLRDIVRHCAPALLAGPGDFLRSHAFPGRVIARGAAIRAHFARSAQLALTAHRADGLDLRRVVLAITSVPFRERHIYQLSHMRRQQ